MFDTPSGSALWSSLHNGSHPLVRHSDRRQARLAAVLLSLALIAGPLVAAYGFTYHASLAQRAAAQQDARTEVTAVLLADAPAGARTDAVALQIPRRATATASWSTQDGLTHTGVVPVDGAAKAGDTVTVWIDRDGSRVGAPLSANQTVMAAILLAFGSWLLFVVALGGTYVLVRARLDRERYAAWEREWRELDERHTP